MPKKPVRRGLRTWELSVIMVVIVAGVLLALPVIRNTVTPAEKRACIDNLKQWGQILALYRNESIFTDPPVHGAENIDANGLWDGCADANPNFNFIPDMRVLVPEYFTDNRILQCPNAPYILPAVTAGPLIIRPERFPEEKLSIVHAGVGNSECKHDGVATNGDISYTYFGFMIDKGNDDDPYISEDLARQHGIPFAGPAQVVGLLMHLAAGTVHKMDARYADINLEDYFTGLDLIFVKAGNQLYTKQPLWSYVQRHYFGAPYSESGGRIDRPIYRDWHPRIPAMWDTIYHNANGEPAFAHNSPNGVNVLYLDGHVEFVEYPGAFPASKAFATMTPVH